MQLGGGDGGKKRKKVRLAEGYMPPHTRVPFYSLPRKNSFFPLLVQWCVAL